MLLYLSFSWTSSYLRSLDLLDGLLDLLGEVAHALFLHDKLILEPVDLLLELLDGALGELGAGLGLLQSGGQGADLLLVRVLSLESLLLRHLERLEVVTDDAELLLELDDLAATNLGTLLSALKISLNHGELTGDLVVFAVGLLGEHLGLLELRLDGVGALLILERAVLHDLADALGLVARVRGLLELLGGDLETLLGALELILQKGHAAVEGGDLGLGLKDLLLLVLKLGVGCGEVLLGLVEVVLGLHHLFLGVTELLLDALELLRDLADLLLGGIGAIEGVVLLDLHGLHLLLDGVHCCAVVGGAGVAAASKT
ncbi:hypothetical protein PENTCL1PPCAC_24428, partial [Pristionchus entomophagus]